MKLFATTTSPFVRKVLVVAHERGLASDLELITLRPSPLKADPGLSKINPLNKIPALILDDGFVVYDSAVISEYLDSLDGSPRLVPASGRERWRVLRLQALADGVLEAGVSAFYERAQRPESHQFQPWIDGQLEKLRQGLDALDAEAKDFDDGIDIGRIAAACTLGWLVFRDLGAPLAGRPHLARWYAKFAERPSMQATAPRA
jgi:glutathione S-transferase